jgi:bifunctional enzyme CysN/CysC
MNHIEREQMNVVIVGHVDHGKSTVIGKLLADTGALPEGKLEAVKATCARNAKPFEYAFLLDALKDEQSQGITIDTARCFFKSKKRDYIIIDAPGHIEFLKNMVTGAARAEAALLVIDAQEGIQENSKRHGYMLSFLGIKNITICINKMDLVHYRQEVFEQIRSEYHAFLNEINITPEYTIPISAREGENMVTSSSRMPWYQGLSILEALDAFRKAPDKQALPLRFPVQDIYKFTDREDSRRIVAGRIETGTVKTGDSVIFYPSGKQSRIKTVEGFHTPVRQEAFAGLSTGFCLETQIYIRPGEIMCKSGESAPQISTKFKANIFWMGKQPFVKNKVYKIKLSTQQAPVVLNEIRGVLDASELSSITNKPLIDRHDVAECILETLKPIAFDRITQIPECGRFVIVDNYEISGGGIILAPVFEEQSSIKEHTRRRDMSWERSRITPEKRAHKYQHKSALIVFTGERDTGKQLIAKALEEALFEEGRFTYFLGISNELLDYANTTNDQTLSKVHHIQSLGEMAHVLTDAGLLLLTSISDIDAYELNMLKSLNHPNITLVVNVGENLLGNVPIDLHLQANESPPQAVAKIRELLNRNIFLDPEYSI